MNVDNLCAFVCGFGCFQVAAVEVGMPVKVVPRFCHLDQPVDGFESPVCPCIIVMDAIRGRVCDEDIHIAPVVDAVQEQTGDQFVCTKIGFSLRILVCPVRTVLDASAQPADQECFDAHQFSVQVRTAFHVRFGIFQGIIGVVVTGNVYKWNIQERNDVFKIWVGKVSAANNQFDIIEMSCITKAVEPFHHFIADCKDFHCLGILP